MSLWLSNALQKGPERGQSSSCTVMTMFSFLCRPPTNESAEHTLLMLKMSGKAQVCVGALLGVLVGVFFPIPTAIAVA